MRGGSALARATPRPCRGLEPFTATSFRLPVKFLLASNAIMRGMYVTLDELVRRAHHEPRGASGLCMEKQDISLKMRTDRPNA